MSSQSETGGSDPAVADTESLTARIIEAVIAYSNRDLDELPLLSDVVDPDALERLFDPLPSGRDRSQGAVTFPYAGYRVDVSADRSISLEPLDETGGRDGGVEHDPDASDY